MPLFYQHNINQDTKLGVWHIEEPESFFLERVPLKRDVSHPHKRLQHLAGRFLLPALFPDFPLAEIVIADTRKPFLENEKYHFSISHCGSYAAAIVSSKNRVGVDIEIISPRVGSIREKFLSPAELANAVPPGGQLLTMLWSAKESIYKWYGAGSVDFRKHMQWKGAVTKENGLMIFPFVFSKTKVIPLVVKAVSFGDVVLAWVVSER